MSEQNPISDDLLQRYFSSANAVNGCPICSTNTWARYVDPIGGGNLGVASLTPRHGPASLEVVVLYCMNCGFVRQHAAHLISLWAAANNG